MILFEGRFLKRPFCMYGGRMWGLIYVDNFFVVDCGKKW